MAAPIITDISTVAIAAREMQIELEYLPIALALDINQFMEGCKFQSFTVKYSRFAEECPTPTLLIEGELHAQQFVDHCGFEGDLAGGAFIWAISRCWKAKAAAKNILRPDVAEKFAKAEEQRSQRTELFKAVSKLAKNKSEDSFEAGFKVNVTQTLESAGAIQLAQLTKKADGEQ
ncbi:MAG: hypothetical protein E6R09_16235 [Rhodocyclaceae bacterium]|nr:MAG: hypothetical protein E6R09_16235 [Rhodocyclaceae bacterium]